MATSHTIETKTIGTTADLEEHCGTKYFGDREALSAGAATTARALLGALLGDIRALRRNEWWVITWYG